MNTDQFVLECSSTQRAKHKEYQEKKYIYIYIYTLTQKQLQNTTSDNSNVFYIKVLIEVSSRQYKLIETEAFLNSV